MTRIKNYPLNHFLTAGVVLLALAGSLFAQEKTGARTPAVIKEVKQKSLATAEAPGECLLAFRQFFSYLQNPKLKIVEDERSQKKWLTEELRKALKEKVTSFKDHPDDPDFPGNGTFIGSWDYPSTYSVVDSRRYAQRAVIDVMYEWGKGTNYPGDTRLSSFVFLFEDGAWKLDDVYTYRGKYVSAESLSQYLREK
jgi:hypothetical protein